MKIAVIGAGPAGLSLAYFLKGTDHQVTVYETLDKPGLKPCAWGLISGVEDLLPISKEAIVSEIRGFRIFLDGKLVLDMRGNRKLGYIINKPVFLQDLAEKVDVRFNSQVTRGKDDSFYVNNKQKIEADKVIFANGHYSLSKDYTILAFQYITDYAQDPELVDFYFFNDLLGYAWIFPDPHGAKIGIGGWASYDFMNEKLKGLLKGRILNYQGARVADYGILEDRLMSENYIGEALGTVFALTGEGIRPSILSAKIMADSLINNKSFYREFKSSKLYWELQVHATMMKLAKRSPNPTASLSRMLLNSDPNLVFKLAIGDISKLELIKLMGRAIL